MEEDWFAGRDSKFGFVYMENVFPLTEPAR